MNFPLPLEDRIASAYDAHVAGQRERAERAYRDLLSEYPDQVDVLFLLSSLLGRVPESLPLAQRAAQSSAGRGGLGVDDWTVQLHYADLLMQCEGDLAEAVRVNEALLSLRPQDPASAICYFRLSDAKRRAGDPIAAMSNLEAYLQRVPGDVNALVNLGTLHFQSGAYSTAVEVLSAALKLQPAHPEALNNLGNAYAELGRQDLAAEQYGAAVDARPGFAEAWTNLGTALNDLGRLHEARVALQEAVRLSPLDHRARVAQAALNEKIVPRWHFPMMNDRSRNEIYDLAITRAVQRKLGAGVVPLVLDIGAGSGLLSMMAARAGAAQVVACEMVDPVAELAEQIVKKNGFGDRISIRKMKSTRLEVGVELPRPADVLVTEIFDVGLLGEFALPVLSHARRELLAPDAEIVPRGARAWVMPIHSAEVFERFRVRNVNACGFDLEAFNEFAKLDYDQLPIRRYAFDALCDPLPAGEFDFRRDVPDRETVLNFTVAKDGALHAWAFWFELVLDEGLTFDTGPYCPETCWAQAIQIEPQPPVVRQGDACAVRVIQSQTKIRFEFVPAGRT